MIGIRAMYSRKCHSLPITVAIASKSLWQTICYGDGILSEVIQCPSRHHFLLLQRDGCHGNLGMLGNLMS